MAGAYVHKLAEAFAHLDYQVDIAVSAYYKYPLPASNVSLLKIFFPLTELVPENPYLRIGAIHHLRYPIRYLEQIIAYTRLLAYVLMRRVDVVNVSLLDNRVSTFLFILVLKVFRKKVLVTAHDVIPFGQTRLPLLRRAILSMADYILVHNDHSRESLLAAGCVTSAHIYSHIFPSSDHRGILNTERYNQALSIIKTNLAGYKRVYLFAGYIRFEKGLDILLDQWACWMGNDPDCVLLIAGEPTVDLAPLKAKVAKCKNVMWILHRQGDEEFLACMDASHVLVMPYRPYANSAVYFNAYLLARRCVIASDVDLFRDFITSKNGFSFSLANPESLGPVLCQVRDLDDQKLFEKAETGRKQLLAEMDLLPSQLDAIYRGFLDSRRGSFGA